MARVVATRGYGTTFNTPRQPRRHSVVQGSFFPLRRFAPPLEGVALPTRLRYDLLHTFNGVPITGRPWLVSFESSLPRVFGDRSAWMRQRLRERLLRENCLAVIPISEYARMRFEHENADWRGLPEVLPKVEVIHPNVPLVQREPKALVGSGLRLLFVGREWARKGGVVAVRVAREALRQGLPVHVTVVSTLDNASFGQHPDPVSYTDDLRLLGLPNVTHHRALPNESVLSLMAQSDFTLLPTAHDTYGYSVVEGMAAGTPAIVTGVAALRYVVQHGANGFSVPLELDGLGAYKFMRSTDWGRWDRLYSEVADEIVSHLGQVLNSPASYLGLSRGAIETVREHHDATRTGALLEALYDRAVAE